MDSLSVDKNMISFTARSRPFHIQVVWNVRSSRLSEVFFLQQMDDFYYKTVKHQRFKSLWSGYSKDTCAKNSYWAKDPLVSLVVYGGIEKIEHYVFFIFSAAYIFDSVARVVSVEHPRVHKLESCSCFSVSFCMSASGSEKYKKFVYLNSHRNATVNVRIV